MVIQLIPSVGFGWAMRICAFLILGLLIFANFSVCSRLPPNKRPFHPMAFIRPLTEPTFAFVTAAIFFFYWGMFIPIIFIVSIARSHGMSGHMSNYLVPILNATSIIGRTVPNALADKVGHMNMMIFMATLTTVMMLGPLMTAANDAAIIAFAAIFGISSGAGVGLAPVIIAHISPIQDIGIRTGTAFAVGAFAVLSGGPIGGQLVTISDGDFKNTVLFGGVSCAIGTGFFILARIARGGLKFTKV
jgi:predicted MFS family arabinose efflux permease